MTTRQRSKRTARWLAELVAGIAISSLPGLAAAQAPAAEPAWQALSPAQRAALAPLRGDWAQFDADRKKKWLEMAQKYESMSPLERQRMQARMTDWSNLTPEERSRARLQYQQARQMGSLDKSDKQEKWDAYQALPSDAKRDLARQSQSERNALDSPARGPRGASAPRASGAAKAVAPAVVQGKPGASTTLMTPTTAPPPPRPPQKIVAPPGQVDKSTLLPKPARGEAATSDGKRAAP